MYGNTVIYKFLDTNENDVIAEIKGSISKSVIGIGSKPFNLSVNEAYLSSPDLIDS